MLKTKAERGYQAKISDSIKRIEDAIANINTNEEWLNYLAFQSKFYNYSFSNVILIYSQMPNAQYVAGYQAWLKLNRYVKRGERAIQILAPIFKRVEKNDEDENRNEEAKTIECYISCFRQVSVFDLSQTTGNDSYIPILVKGISNHSEDAKSIYQKLLTLFNDVSITEVDNLNAKGCFNKNTLSIKIKSGLSDSQKIKTLFHELSHYIHHRDCFEDEPYSIGEIIAESSAFIVCEFIGLDTSDYSFPYVQSWSEGDLTLIKKAGSKVQKISEKIIKKIEESNLLS